MDDARDDEPIAGLTPGVAAAWGVRARPNKGPKRGLSVERIVEAGIKVAITDGLAAVSMNRVAAALGTGPMSLYRYVDSKDELLALMVDKAIGPAPASIVAGDGWRAGLTRWATLVSAGFHRHPWALRVPISGPPNTPNQTTWLEAGLKCLRGTGLEPEEKLSTITLLSGFIHNTTTLEANINAAVLASDGAAMEAILAYGRILERVADPAHFPEVRALVKSGIFDQADSDMHAEFTFGLERILDGIEVLIRKRAGTTGETGETSEPGEAPE